jgi:hypothetical protein
VCLGVGSLPYGTRPPPRLRAAPATLPFLYRIVTPRPRVLLFLAVGYGTCSSPYPTPVPIHLSVVFTVSPVLHRPCCSCPTLFDTLQYWIAYCIVYRSVVLHCPVHTYLP